MNKPPLLLLALCLLLPAASLGAEEPKPAGPAEVTVVDLKDADAATRLQIVCLQGIVNRGAPRPLLYTLHGPSDRAWFDQVYAPRGFKVAAKTPAEAVAAFADRVKGQVFCDPDQPETRNLATALAGLEDALPVTPESARAAWKTVEDFRGKFHSRQEACQWAAEKLFSRCNPRKVALLAPDQVGLRDYLVTEKILPVGLDPKNSAEAGPLRTLLDRYPAGTHLLWGGRVGAPADTRALFARDADGTVPALARAAGKWLLPGAAVANLSFHSRVPAFAPLRQTKRLVQHNVVKYVTFVISGDGNLDFALGRMRDLWDDPARGLVPLGWEIPAAMVDLAPALLSYYYADAWWGGLDQFTMAPSGAGYLLPTDSKAHPNFLAEVGRLARAADLTAVSVVEVGTTGTEKPWDLLAQQPAVRAFLMLGMNVPPTRAADRPLIGENVRVTDPEKAAKAILEAGAKQKFVLAVVDGSRTTPSQVAGVIAGLPRDYVVVRPYEFLDLLSERDVLDHMEPRMEAPARFQSVTFAPAKPGPEDPMVVKATISGRPVDARVVYSLNGGPDLTEPLVFQDGEYRAEIPPTLCAGELKFRLRLADAFLRTHWTDYATATVVAADSDGDGLSDALERIYTLDAGKKDSDGDGLMDANDPAPLSAFALPADWQGPAITAVITTPRMPPAAGREGTLLATVFDPTGVQKVTALVSVGGRSVVSADMRQIGTSQVYQVRIPAFDAEKTVTATVSATNSGGKTSKWDLSLPVRMGIDITRPMENHGTRKDTPVIVRAQAFGKPTKVRFLVNGRKEVEITREPFQFRWDPFEYYPGTHEIVAEAYDDKDQVIDVDVVHVRILGKK